VRSFWSIPAAHRADDSRNLAAYFKACVVKRLKDNVENQIL
jgi:hypothetical protein